MKLDRPGHVSTVNKRTIVPSIYHGFIATTGSMGEKWYKTLADLFSDVLSTREGDLVFFQLTDKDPRPENDNSNIPKSDYEEKYWDLLDPEGREIEGDSDNGFIGLFKITGSPFFDKRKIKVTDEAVVEDSIPIRVPIEPIRFYPVPVTEDRAFNLEPGDSELWNPKFRKALWNPKSLTSISPNESKLLTDLIYKNNDFSHNLESKSYPGDDSNKISINKRLDQTAEGCKPDTIQDVSLDDIPFVSGKKFRTEKALEAWLMENFDKNNSDLIDVFGPREEIEWFTNYVPYGMEGSNIDALSYHERDGITYKISVVELKRTKKEGVVDQVMGYSRWVSKYLADDDDFMVQPIVIANDFDEKDKKKARNQYRKRKPKLVEYRIEDEEVVLDPIFN